MPLPNPNVFALFPLQEVIFDKTTGAPLAYGTVQFFSDPAFNVPKDVYEETQLPGGTITYTNLGNVLTLSGIGSFVDLSGNNFIPLLYPFVGQPSDTIVGAEQLYYIQVYSSDGVLQFTATDWPPNVVQSGGTTTQEALTANLLTNPCFSVVSFIPTAGGNSFTYTTSGTQNFPVAPGWNLQSVSTGSQTITVQQVPLSSMSPNDAAYALQVTWSTGVTSLKLIQTLTASPRLLATFFASATIDCQCPNNEQVLITLNYNQPTTPPVNTQIATGVTPTGGAWGIIDGTKLIPLPTSGTAPQSVDFVINIVGVTPGSSVLITSVQMVEVDNVNVVAGYIQQSTQQELNGLMWYYEPPLAYKPIPSYAVGWNFPFNPCQQFGFAGNTAFPNPIVAQYYIDQTIIYQSTASSMSYTVAQNGTTPPVGLTLTNITGDTFALIQYLDAAEAVELLNQRNAVKLRGYVADVDNPNQSLIGTINLYYTTNVSPYVPALPAVLFGSLSGTGTNLAPASLAAGWFIVPRQLGVASFNLTTSNASFSFNGWDASAVSGINSATAFAIVVSFNKATLGSPSITNTTTLDYITLCGGDIATSPVPETRAEILSKLQYYYETSYALGTPVGTASSPNNELLYYQKAITNGSAEFLQTLPFMIQWQNLKRVAVTPVFYSPSSGTDDNVYGSIYVFTGGNAITNPANADVPIANWTLLQSNTKNATYLTQNSNTNLVTGATANTANPYGIITFHYTANAQLGVV